MARILIPVEQRGEELANGSPTALYEHMMPPDPDNYLQKIISKFDRSWRDNGVKTITDMWEKARIDAGLDPQTDYSRGSSSSGASSRVVGRTVMRGRPQAGGIINTSDEDDEDDDGRPQAGGIINTSDEDDEDDNEGSSSSSAAGRSTSGFVDANGEPVLFKYKVGDNVRYKYTPEVGERRARRSRTMTLTGKITKLDIRRNKKAYAFQFESGEKWVYESDIMGEDFAERRSAAFARSSSEEEEMSDLEMGNNSDSEWEPSDTDDSDSGEEEGAARGAARQRRNLAVRTLMKDLRL